MKSSEFMRALPGAVARRLDGEIALQQGRLWPWGVQLYADDPRFHYEVSRVPLHMGDRLELALHFESRSPAENRAMLAGFAERLWEVRAALGDGIEAEPWDRGWTKVYETIPLEPYTAEYLDRVAARLVEIVRALHPICRDLATAR